MRRPDAPGFNPDQQSFDFNPIEVTPEELERSWRLIAEWTRKEAAVQD